jgi:hypothetical protein
MGAERRASPRRAFAGGRLPPAARIRPGAPVTVVDMGARGTLVEGSLRLRPGSRCEFQFTTAAGDVTVVARVTRCFVARLEASSVRYRAALVFEQAVPLPPEQELLAGYQLPACVPQRAGTGVTASRPAPSASGRGAFGPQTRRDGEDGTWHRP